MKFLNNKIKIELLKVPYEYKAKNILKEYHTNKGHISSKRVVNSIKNAKYYWKSLRNDAINYINNCPICLRKKCGIEIKKSPIKILVKGPLERFVIDGWKHPNSLAELSGYTLVIDVIDHFTKYLWSYPVKNNDSNNALNSIKSFCKIIGFPKILQSDNGSEYKNNIISNFCHKNNIKQIFSSPRHPQTNGVIEVTHKEIRKT